MRLDVGLADRPHRPLQRQALVVGHLELRADLDVELEVHRAVFGQLDRRDVEVGLRDRVELVVLVELLERGHQQRRLDLVGDLLLEPLHHELARGPPGPEARHGEVLAELGERRLELPLDLGPGDGDLDVLLARADIADVDLHLQLPLSTLGRLVLSADGGAALAILILGAHQMLPLGVIPGWDGFWSATTQPERSSESRQPEMASIQSGRRDLNPRHPRWQRGALPLSYSRISRLRQMFRPTDPGSFPLDLRIIGAEIQYRATTPDCKSSSRNPPTPGARRPGRSGGAGGPDREERGAFGSALTLCVAAARTIIWKLAHLSIVDQDPSALYRDLATMNYVLQIVRGRMPRPR